MPALVVRKGGRGGSGRSGDGSVHIDGMRRPVVGFGGHRAAHRQTSAGPRPSHVTAISSAVTVKCNAAATHAVRALATTPNSGAAHGALRIGVNTILQRVPLHKA